MFFLVKTAASIEVATCEIPFTHIQDKEQVRKLLICWEKEDRFSMPLDFFFFFGLSLRMCKQLLEMPYPLHVLVGDGTGRS